MLNLFFSSRLGELKGSLSLCRSLSLSLSLSRLFSVFVSQCVGSIGGVIIHLCEWPFCVHVYIYIELYACVYSMCSMFAPGYASTARPTQTHFSQPFNFWHRSKQHAFCVAPIFLPFGMTASDPVFAASNNFYQEPTSVLFQTRSCGLISNAAHPNKSENKILLGPAWSAYCNCFLSPPLK